MKNLNKTVYPVEEPDDYFQLKRTPDKKKRIIITDNKLKQLNGRNGKCDYEQ